jgi:RNA polymerase sigma factor (sigma-70 family)
MARYFPVFRALGLLLALFSLTFLAPLIYAHVSHDGAEAAYDLAFFVTLGSGLLLWFFARKKTRELNVRDGFLLVVLAWSVLPLYASIPFYVQLEIGFTRAYFEAASGLTATGATVLSRLDELPPSIHLWRCLIIWLGGMGLIVLAVAILPMLGIGGRQMFKAETPSPMKDTKLTPRITQTAKGLWLVYVGITSACALAYRWAGMSGFDAVCHAFSTVALGGFSTHDASFAYWNSPQIEGVAIFFMLIAGMNFSTHYVAILGKNLHTYLRDPEILWFLGVLLVSVLLITFYLWVPALRQHYANPALRGLQPHFHRDHGRFYLNRLQPLALFRAALHVVPVQFRFLFRLYRRRHQNDAGGAALQTGVSGTFARHAPQCRLPGQAGGTHRAAKHALCRAGLRLYLYGDAGQPDSGIEFFRSGNHHRLFRRRRLAQQHRPRSGHGRPRRQLCRPEQFPDLGLRPGHAAGPAGDFHAPGCADARVLAKIAPGDSALPSTPCKKTSNDYNYQQFSRLLIFAFMSSPLSVVHTLYNDHYGWLKNWLSRKLGSRADAADLAHDTFVRLLLKNDLQEIATPRAFLRTISHGLIVDHWRRQALERAYFESIAQLPEAEAPSAESRVMILELLERVMHMLEGLKPKVCTAFLLVYCRELAFAEAAARMGVLQRTVERYVAEALFHCHMLRETT